MNVIDLYNFAVSNNLLNNSVEDTVKLYHIYTIQNLLNNKEEGVSIFGNKIEYTIEDLLDLFDS